jgi:hypothetical protein
VNNVLSRGSIKGNLQGLITNPAPSRLLLFIVFYFL